MSNPEIDSLFRSAVEEISNGDYHKAKADLLAIKEKGISSGPIEYNLAETYFHTNDLGFAIAHLNNAIHLDRFNFQYREELEKLQKKVTAGTGTQMDHPVESAFLVRSFLRPNEALFLGSLFLLAFLFLKLLHKKAFLKFSCLTLTILFAFLAGFSYWGQNMAVVKVESKLKETPLLTAKTIRGISAGSRLHIIKESGDFLEVERSKSFRGWVPKEDIYLLK